MGNFSDFVLSHIFAGAAEIIREMRAGHSSILLIYTYLLNLYFFLKTLSKILHGLQGGRTGTDRGGSGVGGAHLLCPSPKRAWPLSTYRAGTHTDQLHSFDDRRREDAGAGGRTGGRNMKVRDLTPFSGKHAATKMQSDQLRDCWVTKIMVTIR